MSLVYNSDNDLLVHFAHGWCKDLLSSGIDCDMDEYTVTISGVTGTPSIANGVWTVPANDSIHGWELPFDVDDPGSAPYILILYRAVGGVSNWNIGVSVRNWGAWEYDIPVTPYQAVQCCPPNDSYPITTSGTEYENSTCTVS